MRMQNGGMRVTPTMIQAARRAEFDYYQKGRTLGADRFIPTPDVVIRAMLEAVLKITPDQPPAPDTPKGRAGAPRIVVSSPPRRRR
jgi:hypothetical protein